MEVTLNEKMANTKPLTIEANISSLFIQTTDEYQRTTVLKQVSDYCCKQFGLVDFNIYILRSNKGPIPIFMGMLTAKQKKEIHNAIMYNFREKKNKIILFTRGLNIAIDARLLSPVNQWGVVFTAKEIVAGIIHEIGHIMHIEDIVSNISEKMTMDTSLNSKSNIDEYIMNRVDEYMMNVDKDSVEISADTLPIKYGYGQELVSLLQKFKKIYEKAGSNSVSNQHQVMLRKRYDNVVTLLMSELRDDENDDASKQYIRKQLSKIKAIGY